MLQDLNQQAVEVLNGNDRGTYTLPTSGLYPYQWNWDSAICALGYSTYDIDRAWTELETLFAGQWSGGMVPHILFHESDPGYFPGPEVWGGRGPVPSSGITQPPVAISAARMIYERAPEQGGDRLAKLYPSMLAWHRWFMRWRLDAGAVCVSHPWEAGRDNAPDWDGAMARIKPNGVGTYQRRDTDHVSAHMRPSNDEYDRYVWLVQLGRRLKWDEAALRAENPFRVADPAMTFICLRAARDLLAVGESCGFETNGLRSDIASLERGAETLWNGAMGCYDSRTVPGGFTGSLSNASFLCWYAGLNDERQLPELRRALERSAYPIASYDPDSQHFDPVRYWRGPTWAFMNMLIGTGLAEFDYPEARILRDATRSLISRSGFSEYFNPLTGDPAGGNSFAWTAAVWLAWAGPTAGET
ncbi:MAG: hypothetical protein OXF74_01550 [Rhodobacteraceae bacterium]|nr:hypothetical protein [Paracoccaceae bacterium]